MNGINNYKKNENITVRIDTRFKKEMEEIKEERIKRGIDKKKVSDRFITNLTARNYLWRQIKKEIIEYGENRR